MDVKVNLNDCDVEAKAAKATLIKLIDVTHAVVDGDAIVFVSTELNIVGNCVIDIITADAFLDILNDVVKQ